MYMCTYKTYVFLVFPVSSEVEEKVYSFIAKNSWLNLTWVSGEIMQTLVTITYTKVWNKQKNQNQTQTDITDMCGIVFRSPKFNVKAL